MSDYTYDTGASHYVFDQTSGRSATPSGTGLESFEVDTESLANAAQTLDRLADFVEQTMLVDMKLNLDLGAAAGGSSKGEIVFGRFEASSDVAAKQRSHYQTAVQSTNALLQSLRSIADGTRDVAEKYKGVEEANKASAQAIESILASGDSGSPAAGPGSYGSGNQYGSGTQSGSGSRPASYDTQSEGVGY